MPRGQQAMSAPFGRVAMPMQHMASAVLENMERITHLQLDMMQSYTHFTLTQWRDALSVENPGDISEYMTRYNRAAQEFSRKVADDTREALDVTRRTSEQALRVVPETTREATTSAARATEQVSERAQQAAEKATELPIRNYDELSASDIENRLDQLNTDQIQALREYESKNKGRKTLDQAFERRLNG